METIAWEPEVAFAPLVEEGELVRVSYGRQVFEGMVTGVYPRFFLVDNGRVRECFLHVACHLGEAVITRPVGRVAVRGRAVG